MAIGLGEMFGFHFLENFNYPYISKSITDFWRRWHISLSSWFRDYIYIPLGGNRVKKLRHIFNIFVVWALTGLWHGAAWNSCTDPTIELTQTINNDYSNNRKILIR